MGTQQGIYKFTGKVGDMRGYKRSLDTKSKTFVGKSGGPNKTVFSTGPNMGSNRRNANEFQGCIGLAFFVFNFLSKVFICKGLDLKTRLFKFYKGQIQNGSGDWGYRQLLVGTGTPFPVPFQVGRFSIDKVFKHKYTTEVDGTF